MKNWHSPWWLPGGHVQTIWSARLARTHLHKPRAYRRERWDSPDQDFIDVDIQCARSGARPTLVLFHGLEGNSQSHYAKAFADWAQEQDVHCLMPHFRGCSGEINTRPRAYHSGDHAEVDWILRRALAWHRAQGGQQMVGAGISLGGNALMHWAGLHENSALQHVQAIASISSPLDLMRSGKAMGQGLNRQIYTRMFLATMKPKAMAKLQQFPGLFDGAKVLAATDLEAFDDAFTAPLHGFAGVHDYWTRASAKPLLRGVAVPALALNALNDPFVPADSLPQAGEVSSAVTLWQPPHGGHVGFAQGRWPAQMRPMADAVGGWLLTRAAQARGDGRHG